MSRYVDADKLCENLTNMAKYQEPYKQSTILGVVSTIENTKTADVVEVVRCKDCKYLYCLSAVDRQFYCRHHPQGLKGINIVEDNPYCSYGERSENGK